MRSARPCTASAVVADIVDIARLATADPEHRVPYLAFQPDRIADLPLLPIDAVESSYYLRVCVIDKPGVLAELTHILADESISIEALIQKGSERDGQAEIVLLTHRVVERRVQSAMARIEALASVTGKVVRLRMEALNG